METMALWEKLLIGVVVVLILLWFGPGVKARLEQSRRATSKDWTGLLLPVGAVVLFVIFLISMVSN